MKEIDGIMMKFNDINVFSHMSERMCVCSTENLLVWAVFDVNFVIYIRFMYEIWVR